MIFFDSSIYDDIEKLGLAEDIQGWGSKDPIFKELIYATKPKIIVEIGSWKGASAIRMAQFCSELYGQHGEPWRLYCVDTWLGSIEHWCNPEKSGFCIPRKHGYPQLYFQFLHNVKSKGYHRNIVPIPMPSSAAATLLQKANIVPDLIYVDGSHDLLDVTRDIEQYWNLLSKGGVIFGDDWKWKGVCAAVIEASKRLGACYHLHRDRFWSIQKLIHAEHTD